MKSAWESGMLGLPEKKEKTFGEDAFNLLSEKLGRTPTADELITYIQSQNIKGDGNDRNSSSSD